ncbi:hypothetical protein D3C76_1573880 [compost metagenome]
MRTPVKLPMDLMEWLQQSEKSPRWLTDKNISASGLYTMPINTLVLHGEQETSITIIKSTWITRIRAETVPILLHKLLATRRKVEV